MTEYVAGHGIELYVHKWDKEGRECELRYRDRMGRICQFCGFMDYEKGLLLAKLWNMNKTEPKILQEYERQAHD